MDGTSSAVDVSGCQWMAVDGSGFVIVIFAISVYVSGCAIVIFAIAAGRQLAG